MIQFLNLAGARLGALLLVFVIHVLIGFVLFSTLKNGRISTTEQSIEVRLLFNEQPELTIELPEINLNLRNASTPAIKFSEPEFDSRILMAPDDHILSANRTLNSQTGMTVFDARLRKRLDDIAAQPKLQRAKTELRSFIDLTDNQFIDVGDGRCLRSMQKMESHQRERVYSGVDCGKTDSEKMMENIVRDVDARKRNLQ